MLHNLFFICEDSLNMPMLHNSTADIVRANDYCMCWCKREHVESNALNNWKLKIFKIIDERVFFYSNNLDLLPPKPKLSFRYLKQGIQEFHRKYVLIQADKAANNVVDV